MVPLNWMLESAKMASGRWPVMAIVDEPVVTKEPMQKVATLPSTEPAMLMPGPVIRGGVVVTAGSPVTMV